MLLIFKIKTNIMKRLCVISIMATIFVVSSCKGLHHAKFDAAFDAAVTIPAEQTANTTTTLYAASITTNIGSLVKANNTRTDLLNSVTLTNLSVSLSSPAGKTFSFLDDVRILISTESQGETEVAFKHHLNSNSGSFDCDLDDVDLKQFIISDSIKVKVVIINSQAFDQDVSTNLHFKFHFDANLLAGAGL